MIRVIKITCILELGKSFEPMVRRLKIIFNSPTTMWNYVKILRHSNDQGIRQNNHLHANGGVYLCKTLNWTRRGGSKSDTEMAHKTLHCSAYKNRNYMFTWQYNWMHRWKNTPLRMLLLFTLKSMDYIKQFDPKIFLASSTCECSPSVRVRWTSWEVK
jgi:hypothetical protein